MINKVVECVTLFCQCDLQIYLNLFDSIFLPILFCVWLKKEFLMEEKSSLDKTRMSIQARSQGDGMEMMWDAENSVQMDNFFINLTSDVQNSSCPFVPSVASKRKEPKFVPYEPYKAAVSHILPKNIEKQHKDKCITTSSHSKDHVFKLVSHSSENSVNESLNFSKSIKIETPPEMTTIGINYGQINELENISWLAEKLILQEKVKKLIEEKKELERQFDIQTKVNADLKKLLVASLGEDMQAKVQYMSEDKAKLGEHVLLFSQKLSENNEELEKLSTQCDMWKRKFEVCSLLMDEYVACKAVLSKKYSESTDAIQCLIAENKDIYNLLEETFWILYHIQEAFDPSAKWNSPCNQSPWNLIQLTSATRVLSDGIETRLIGESAFKSSQKYKKLMKRGLTYSEHKANEVLVDVETLPELIRLEIKKKGANNIATHTCLYLSQSCSKEATVNCCKHCSGAIKLV